MMANGNAAPDDRPIARIWRGQTRVSDAQIYHDYLDRTGVAAFRSTPGCRGAFVMRRIHGEIAEFMLISLWDSYEAMRAFAPDPADPGKARYYPDDAVYLLEMTPRVDLFEVLEDPVALRAVC